MSANGHVHIRNGCATRRAVPLTVSNPGEGILQTPAEKIVAARDRGAASALNFLVAFGAQAFAAAMAGALIYRLGYAPMLQLAAGVCATAALLFAFLREKMAAEPPADQ